MTSFIFRICWSPSGKLLAVSSDRYAGSGDAAITILALDGFEPRGPILKAHLLAELEGHHGAFLDESTLIYSGVGQGKEGIYTYNLKSGKRDRLLNSGEWPTSIVPIAHQ